MTYTMSGGNANGNVTRATGGAAVVDLIACAGCGRAVGAQTRGGDLEFFRVTRVRFTGGAHLVTCRHTDQTRRKACGAVTRVG